MALKDSVRPWGLAVAGAVLAACSVGGSAFAEWKAAGDSVEAAIKDPRIAAVLASVNVMDRALIDDDHAAFAAFLADDLVVNNPQNTLSEHAATAQRNATGLISYTSYTRTIEYAGLRGDMVLLMGEEVCVPKPPNPMAGQKVRRRFSDLWKAQNGRWVLTARQATIIPFGR
jgi:ketosteroid isomerase-like protein